MAELLASGPGWFLSGDPIEVPETESEPAWQGNFTSCDAVAATDTDIYVAGSYVTVTPEGGEQRPFVARITPQGEQLWFRQLAVPDLAQGPITHLLPTSRGSLLVAGTSGFVLELNARDGAPLAPQAGEP